MGDTSVDFDFGHDGRTDGFDAWRLWRFAKQFPNRYGTWQELDVVEQALQDLIERGVAAGSGHESDNLFYIIQRSGG